MSRLSSCIALTSLLAWVAVADASTWYVRTDGGDTTQCTGQSDAAYPGSGTGQACAYNHLFQLLKPNGSGGLSGAAVLQGGDTVIVGPGEYMMGVGAPGSSSCNAAWGYNCTLPPIPSGPDASHPTVIAGKGWDTKASAPPQLWGYGRLAKILNLTGSSNVQIKYFEITDHSSCIYNANNPAVQCDRAAPYNKPFADVGVYATDSSNVLLKDLNIHGISKTGIHAGRLTDWTVEDVHIRAAGFTGWDGDVGKGLIGSGTDSSNSGTITIRSSKIEYTGCGDSYPSTDLHTCHGQSQQGQGDGFGTYVTNGDWVIEDSEFSHNLQDGFDLLYHTGNGTVTVKNSRFEGNAGNGLKVSAAGSIENSVFIGNCDYFMNNPISDTYTGTVESCRAGGTPLMTSGWRSGRVMTMTNSTITGSTTVLQELKAGIGVSKTVEVTGSLASITGGNEYAMNSTDDKVWLRPLGPWNPNNMEFVVVDYSKVRTLITGTWTDVGNNTWELSGYRAQTGNVDTFEYVYLGFKCDGTARMVGRNNIAVGMESWYKKTHSEPGVKSTYQYLDGYDGNSHGSCAAEGTAIVLDNADSIVYNTDVRYPYCPNSDNILCSDPLLVNIPPLSITANMYTYGDWWDVSPSSSSPALAKTSSLPGATVYGAAVVPSVDLLGTSRAAESVTWGAYAVANTGGASVTPTPGSCGSSNGLALSTAPSTGLCSAGTASAVTGSGPWSWSCAGSGGGSTASCSASLAASVPAGDPSTVVACPVIAGFR